MPEQENSINFLFVFSSYLVQLFYRVRTEDGSDGHHLLENQEFGKQCNILLRWQNSMTALR